jgi:energy-coupling factor transporter ATP-binding protein EcfA2
MPSRIARLYVDNYRCFVNFELRPGRRSLLLGYNGSGKSSVFDVLRAIKALVHENADTTDVFPTDTVAKFGGSSEQRFELDVETERGMLRYVLHLAPDLDTKTAAITLEELRLDDKLAYRFANGEVQLYGEDDAPARGPFPFSPQRSFLASLDLKAPLSPVASFKEFLFYCWILRLDPVRISASAPEEAVGFYPDASNFASWCRYRLQERPDRMQRAHEALREIIPGFQHLRMQSAGRSKVLVATFRYPGGSSYDLDFDALSDGQKALIVFYVVLHTTGHQSVLCLDEPENFVSIREIQPFLTELADLSDETGIQVLLISHSPEVIDYVGASGAILLERPEGGHTRVRSVEATGPLRLSERMARGWLSGGSDGAS